MVIFKVRHLAISSLTSQPHSVPHAVLIAFSIGTRANTKSKSVFNIKSSQKNMTTQHPYVLPSLAAC